MEIDSNLAGSFSLEVLVSTEEEGGIKEPELLRRMACASREKGAEVRRGRGRVGQEPRYSRR